MIRVKISNFIKKNINKLRDLGIKLIIVAIVVFIATIILSLSKQNNNANNIENNKSIYQPTKTIIKGSDVSKKQYETDSNIIDKFIECCNNKQIEEAYNMISDECKEVKYNTIDIFRTAYYNPIFNKEREYNLQSWISTKEYTVYKIRYTTDALSTGNYLEDDIYQDYITLIKNSDGEKISIGSFITSENVNVETYTNEIDAKVIKKHIYLDTEEYIIQIRNKTENTILLDTLNTSSNIVVIGDNEVKYKIDINELFKSDLIVQSKIAKNIKIKFKKEANSNNKSKYIQFSNIIRDYEEYNLNSNNYNDIYKIKIKV